MEVDALLQLEAWRSAVWSACTSLKSQSRSRSQSRSWSVSWSGGLSLSPRLSLSLRLRLNMNVSPSSSPRANKRPHFVAASPPGFVGMDSLDRDRGRPECKCLGGRFTGQPIR